MKDAKKFYEESRGSSAFNMPKNARFVGSNQHGKRYLFPDGSYLRIDTEGNSIEWREKPGYGSFGITDPLETAFIVASVMNGLKRPYSSDFVAELRDRVNEQSKAVQP